MDQASRFGACSAFPNVPTGSDGKAVVVEASVQTELRRYHRARVGP